VNEEAMAGVGPQRHRGKMLLIKVGNSSRFTETLNSTKILDVF